MATAKYMVVSLTERDDETGEALAWIHDFGWGVGGTIYDVPDENLPLWSCRTNQRLVRLGAELSALGGE